MPGEIRRDCSRPFFGQRLIALRRSGRVGVGEDVDEGLVPSFHSPGDLEQGCVGLRFHRSASGIERESRRNSDDDAGAEVEDVEPDSRGLLA